MIPTNAFKYMVERIVDRCHVGDSNLEVWRTVRRSVRPEIRTKWITRGQYRTMRRAMQRAAFRRHSRNGFLYNTVMRGGF